MTTRLGWSAAALLAAASSPAAAGCFRFLLALAVPNSVTGLVAASAAGVGAADIAVMALERAMLPPTSACPTNNSTQWHPAQNSTPLILLASILNLFLPVSFGIRMFRRSLRKWREC